MPRRIPTQGGIYWRIDCDRIHKVRDPIAASRAEAVGVLNRDVRDLAMAMEIATPRVLRGTDQA